MKNLTLHLRLSSLLSLILLACNLAFGQLCFTNYENGSSFRFADHQGATEKASNLSIHVDLGVVNLHSSELNFLP